jgi:hypothetical protein
MLPKVLHSSGFGLTLWDIAEIGSARVLCGLAYCGARMPANIPIQLFDLDTGVEVCAVFVPESGAAKLHPTILASINPTVEFIITPSQNHV